MREVALATTDRAMRWVDQFEPADRSAARDLVHNLRLVSRDEFATRLENLVEEVLSTVSGPLGILPVREVIQGESVFPVGRDSEPSALDGRKALGSEGICGQIATQIARRNPKLVIRRLGLNDLRNRRARGLLLLDDLVGSGSRLASYVQSIFAHKTIRSWHSYGFLKFFVAVYAASPKQRAQIGRTAPYPELNSYMQIPTFFEENTRNSSPILRQLMRKYGLRTSRPQFSMGYGDVCCSLVFSHGCPNNVPSILWSDSSSWMALFPGRTIPPELAPAFGQKRTLRSALWALVSQRTPRQFRGQFAVQEDERAEVVTLLSAMRKRPNTPDRLSEMTGIPEMTCIRWLAGFVQEGLATKDRRLTDFGREEVRRLEALSRGSQRRAESTGPVMYFPRSLRGGQ